MTSRGGQRGRALRWLALGLSSVFLTACAAIPRSGPVVRGDEANDDPREGIVQLVPAGPEPGADPVGIVTGFLNAAVGFSDDHQVARGFLSARRRLTWRPDNSVTVYPTESALTVKQTSVPEPAAAGPAVTTPAAVAGVASTAVATTAAAAPGAVGAAHSGETAQTAKVVVQTPVDARIDADGRYTLAPPRDQMTTTFELVKVGGQWRINELSDGILVPANEFAVTYRPFPVYFADLSGRFLVPDVHWFPGARDQFGSPELPTALVRVLLDGPPPWLRGAVSSGAPAGTEMAVSAVVVSNQVATVDLTTPVKKATGRQRQLLLSQLQATLGHLQTIGAVQITVHRTAFDVPQGANGTNDPSQPEEQPVDDPPVDSKPVVIDSKGRVARFNGVRAVAVKNVADLAVPGANRPAVSYDSSSYAVLNADRSKLLLQLPGTKVATLVKAVQLTAPSFDPQGWVWTSAADGGSVYAAGADPGTVKVRASWLKRFRVVSLRISRDGTRAAVAVTYHDQAHVYLAGVVRDSRGVPQELTAPLGLIPDLVSVRDLSWVDEDQIVVLGRRGSAAQERPWIVQIGGTIEPASPITGAESITAGNGEASVLAGTAKGTLGREGIRWDTLTSARWPAFPG